jgi:hypothetical protein
MGRDLPAKVLRVTAAGRCQRCGAVGRWPGLVNTNIHEIERTRPAQYARTGYTARAGELAAREEFMKTKILPAGMDPMEVGQRVLRGILRDDLYILTHPDEPGLRERFEAILACMPFEGPTPPAARVAAEAMVLRNPLFAMERDRQLLQRSAAHHAQAARAGPKCAQARARSRAQVSKVNVRPKRAGLSRRADGRVATKRSRKG